MSDAFKDRLRQRIVASQRLTQRVFTLAYFANRVAIWLAAEARRLVGFVNEHLTDAQSDRFVVGLPGLHRAISDVLAEQARAYPHYAYSYGFPYQAFATLGIFGERPTEERFDAYRLASVLRPEHHVLDIGCNCGFVGIYAAYRTGCRVTGVDINPYMIRIGQLCTDYLRLGERVKLLAARFQDFSSESKFHVVFSFATHWTDDGNYRVELREHLEKIHRLLTDDGMLVLESHCGDFGQEKFHATLEEARTLFAWDERLYSDKRRREVYLMKKR